MCPWYRYDVLMTANKPVGNYWLTAAVVNGTRLGSPAGYGVLRYVGANASALPSEPIKQPETVPAWSPAFLNQVWHSLDIHPLCSPSLAIWC